MQELTPDGTPQRLFKAGQFWNSNVYGAALAGAGGSILFLVVMGIAVWLNPAPKVILFAATWAVVIVVTVLCFLPGNLIVAFPYAVSVEGGRGLRLYAPLKKVYIPIEDIRDIKESSLQQGYVVRLKRRHGLLKSFVIHWFFGDQAEPLASAIQGEIRRHASLT